MRGRVHIFSASRHVARSVQRHLRYGLQEGCAIELFAFAEIDPGVLRFDAAVADAFEIRDGTWASSGVDLFERFPGQVVLVSTLWTTEPPINWQTCVALPQREPGLLIGAVRRALSREGAAAPTRAELRNYLPLPLDLQHRERRMPTRDRA